jgi:excisionase family DNA binding protein
MTWATVKQVAEHLQVSEAKVYAMARSGDMPAQKIGSQWRFDIAEVDDWVRRQGSSRNRVVPRSSSREGR